MSEPSQEEKDRQTLMHSAAFWGFLENQHQAREGALAAMRDADDATLRKLAGAVSVYTDILQMYEWDKVQIRMTPR